MLHRTLLRIAAALFALAWLAVPGASALTVAVEAAPAALDEYLAAHPEVTEVPLAEDAEFIRDALNRSDAVTSTSCTRCSPPSTRP